MNGIDIFCFSSPYNQKNIFRFLILSFAFSFSSFLFYFFTFLRPSFASRLSRNITLSEPSYLIPACLPFVLSFRQYQLLFLLLRISRPSFRFKIVTASPLIFLHKKDGGAGVFVFAFLIWKAFSFLFYCSGKPRLSFLNTARALVPLYYYKSICTFNTSLSGCTYLYYLICHRVFL